MYKKQVMALKYPKLTHHVALLLTSPSKRNTNYRSVYSNLSINFKNKRKRDRKAHSYVIKPLGWFHTIR